MIWVTRSHVHVDRVACPWLISRFIDSEAEFIFVPKSQVEQVAKEMGAIPFDAPQVELGHKNGKCSFETIIEKYGLTDPALLRLAKIVHAADIEADAGAEGRAKRRFDRADAGRPAHGDGDRHHHARGGRPGHPAPRWHVPLGRPHGGLARQPSGYP